MRLTTHLLPVILLLLGGCSAMMNTGSTELSCGTANKGYCMSMSQAWEASSDYRPQDHVVSSGGTSGRITPFLPDPVPNMAAIDEPKPLLMPARVLRVWVNAYEDSNGNLVYPTRVFSEVTPRRWNVGYSAAQMIQSSRTVTPLVAVGSAAAPTEETPPAAARVESSDARTTAAEAEGTESAPASPTTPATQTDTLPPGALTPPLQ